MKRFGTSAESTLLTVDGTCITKEVIKFEDLDESIKRFRSPDLTLQTVDGNSIKNEFEDSDEKIK